MPAILPLLCFSSMLIVLRNSQVLDWRGSFLLAALLWGFLLTSMTEFLSLFSLIAFWPVLGAWVIIWFLLLLIILVLRSWQHFVLRQPLHLISISGFEFSLLVCLFLITIALGIIAWVSPPNTPDSMTYHMSRVMHWIQNQSVAFYPTHIPRQLHLSPWSEFAILHFQILADGDRFANFVQWFSMVGSIVGVSLIAKELKATIRGQIFAAVVCATIPMGILQGSSTQTDYVVSFWLVCFVYFAMCLIKKANLLYALGTGAALGLATLTKATAYIFASPFLIWLGLSSIKHRQAKKMLFIALALVIALVANLGHYARNYDLYGNPIGPFQDGANFFYANEVFTFSAVASNVIRNVGLHLFTPFKQVNSILYGAISSLHELIGISLNDVRTTWGGTEFHTSRLFFNEDFAGNIIHLIFIAISLLLYVCARPREREAGFYIFSILAAFLLFCVFLKWQPWHGRLHLPLFVLSSPFVGLMVSRIQGHKIPNLSMALLILLALPFLFYNSNKPIFGKNSIFTTSRIKQYFRKCPEMAGPYIEAAQILSNLHCSDIGLVVDRDGFEYPLWILLRNQTNEIVCIEHVNVKNISKRTYHSKLNVCAIFGVNADPPNAILIGDIVYWREWSSKSVSVYIRTTNP
jgi:hypothetical protein